MNDRPTADPPDPLEGSDPIDFDAIPYPDAVRVTEVLATSDADRWGEWFLSTDVADAGAIRSGGVAALDAIWAGVIGAAERGWFGSCTWAELVAAGPVPVWCRIRPGFEQYFGATGCWVAAGAIALTSRWIEREWGGTWVLPPDRRGLDRAEPGIAIPGGRGFVPQVQVVGSVGRVSGLRGAPERDPGRLRELVLMYEPDEAVPPTAAPDDGSDPTGPGVSSTGDAGRWTIGFSDAQAHDESDRIDRFVDALSTSDDIGRAHREDRDVVIAESVVDRDRLQRLADEAWLAVL